MTLADIVLGWLSISFYRLWHPIMAVAGFSSPVSLVVIAGHNMLSVSYLMLVTAVGYLAWRKRGWMLSLAVFLAWTIIGLLLLGVYSQLYGALYSFVAVFAHGWLELSAIVYWLYRLRGACKRCQVGLSDDWSTWTEWLRSVRHPKRLFSLMVRDAKEAYNLTISTVRQLWSEGLRRDLILVCLLIFFSAAMETYVTPSLARPFLN